VPYYKEDIHQFLSLLSFLFLLPPLENEIYIGTYNISSAFLQSNLGINFSLVDLVLFVYMKTWKIGRFTCQNLPQNVCAIFLMNV